METELKLSFPSDEALLSCGEAGWLMERVRIVEKKTEVYENRYLDTKDRILHQRRTSLRVRHVVGQNYIFTVKTAPIPITGKNTSEVSSGLTSRCEWNVESERPFFDARAFITGADRSEDPIPILEAALRPIMDKELETVCKTEFTRHIIDVQFMDSMLEICLDTGACLAGEKSLPICEMEIELISGKTDAVQQLGSIVMRNCNCTSGTLSKYARCLLLLNEEKV